MAKQNKSGVPSTPFFYLRDFGETQHYTGRSPKWIKLSLDLLNDNAFYWVVHFRTAPLFLSTFNRIHAG